VGIFPFRTHMTEKSMKMGYVEVDTKAACALFPSQERVRGHVYHFSEILQVRHTHLSQAKFAIQAFDPC
jgi:cobyrinic acid a,c-diamide synthase